MFREAQRLAIPASGYMGGLILDEMAIDATIALERHGKTLNMVGFADLGEESKYVTYLIITNYTFCNDIANLIYIWWIQIKWKKPWPLTCLLVLYNSPLYHIQHC